MTGAKAGRNDPCWCGSGEKYKRCHLDRDERIERELRAVTNAKHDDQNSILLNVYAPTLPNFEERVIGPAEAIRRTLIGEMGAGGLAGREAAEALERTLEELEAQIKTIASRHSRAFWLHLVRRLDPEPVGESSEWTVTLYRRILDLAVLKHGLPEMREQEFHSVVHGGIFGASRVLKKLDDEDLIAVQQLEFLGYEYGATAAAFRRVGKGAVLDPVSGDWFGVPADAEVEDLMALLDHRSERYGDLGAVYGMLADPSPDRLSLDTAPMHLIAPVLNVERVPPNWFKGLSGPEFARPMTFNFVTLSFQDAREMLNLFAPEVELATGAEPDVILATLWALSTKAMFAGRENPLADAQLVRTGYRPFSSGERYEEFLRDHGELLAVWWEQVREEKLDRESAEARLQVGLKSLTYTEEDIASISLWDRLPAKVILPAEGEDFFFIDHSAFPAVLSGLFGEVGLLDGSPANIKARAFEEEVSARVRAAGLQVWMETTELIAEDGSRREIDLGVVCDTTLFVIECKAFAQNPRIDRGDFAAFKGRRETLEKYLGQAATLSVFLEGNRFGRNYEIPSCVTRVEPVLCTAAVEYLWTLEDDELWIEEPRRMPRICVPGELIDNLTDNNPFEYPASR
jgi:SEC-C motif